MVFEADEQHDGDVIEQIDMRRQHVGLEHS